jgi:hypothetical protein
MTGRQRRLWQKRFVFRDLAMETSLGMDGDAKD